MRTKVEYRTASRESYDRFISTHPDVNITYEKFKQIIYTFSYYLRDHILETGEMIKLPFGMGELSINKRKTRRVNKYNKIILPIDWVATKKNGFKTYNFNDHTEGYKFRWIWFRGKARFGYALMWVFKPSRTTSRLLAKYLKQPNSKYQFLYREYWK